MTGSVIVTTFREKVNVVDDGHLAIRHDIMDPIDPRSNDHGRRFKES